MYLVQFSRLSSPEVRGVNREFCPLSNEPWWAVMEEVKTTILELVSRFVESLGSLDVDFDSLHHIDFRIQR